MTASAFAGFACSRGVCAGILRHLEFDMHAGAAVNGLVFSGPAVVAGDHTIQWSNRVTNKAEADRIIRRWAKLLNEHLAEVQSATSNK